MDMKATPKGLLASQAGYDLTLEPLCSAAGYYLGTFSPQDGPITRESVEYFRSKEAAAKAMETGEWTQREHV